MVPFQGTVTDKKKASDRKHAVQAVAFVILDSARPADVNSLYFIQVLKGLLCYQPSPIAEQASEVCGALFHMMCCMNARKSHLIIYSDQHVLKQQCPYVPAGQIVFLG